MNRDEMIQNLVIAMCAKSYRIGENLAVDSMKTIVRQAGEIVDAYSDEMARVN